MRWREGNTVREGSVGVRKGCRVEVSVCVRGEEGEEECVHV